MLVIVVLILSKSEAVNLLRNGDLTEKKREIKNTTFCLSNIKIRKKIAKSGDTKTEKQNFNNIKAHF